MSSHITPAAQPDYSSAAIPPPTLVPAPPRQIPAPQYRGHGPVVLPWLTAVRQSQNLSDSAATLLASTLPIVIPISPLPIEVLPDDVQALTETANAIRHCRDAESRVRAQVGEKRDLIAQNLTRINSKREEINQLSTQINRAHTQEDRTLAFTRRANATVALQDAMGTMPALLQELQTAFDQLTSCQHNTQAAVTAWNHKAH